MDTILKNFKQLLTIWAIVIVVNQILIFNACFELYCLIAAMPHTFVIAALITYFMHKDNNTKKKESD